MPSVWPSRPPSSEPTSIAVHPINCRLAFTRSSPSPNLRTRALDDQNTHERCPPDCEEWPEQDRFELQVPCQEQEQQGYPNVDKDPVRQLDSGRAQDRMPHKDAEPLAQLLPGALLLTR